MKCFRTYRFDVIGFTTELRDDGAALASLVLAGRTRNAERVYADRVEVGVPGRDRTLLNALESMTLTQAQAERAPVTASITWVAPKLSAEVRCLAWEPGRYIRDGALRGLALAP